MTKQISHERVLELLQDPQFLLVAAESPWAFADEVQAISDYVASLAPQIPEHLRAAPLAPTRIVGRRIRRVEDPDRLTGRAIYATDVHLPGMLYTAILHSPHAHAMIEDIDASAAEKLAGVRAVLTYKNVLKERIGGPPDMFILNQEIHFAGEEVAVVAAEDPHTASEAVGLIKVTYKILPSVVDPEAALQRGAPNLQTGGTVAVGFGEAGGAEGTQGKAVGNKLALSFPLTKRGNFDAAYAAAAAKHEGTYSTSTVQHGTLEPRAAVAYWSGPDQLTVWASTQYIMGVRAELATTFGLPRSHVRVLCDHTGGGFGDKSSAVRQGRIAAVLAAMTQRPVRVAYDRNLNFKAATHRYATAVKLKGGTSSGGKLSAYRADAISDSGAYLAFSLPDVMVSLARTYHVENAHFEQVSVLTNRVPSGYQRCVGNPQGTFAQEIFIDELAEKAGIDPLTFRLNNVETRGDQDSKLPWASCGIVECLQEGAKSIGWQQKWHKPGAKIVGNKAHGIGMVAHACAHGGMAFPMTAMMKIDRDGSLDVIQSTTDIGAGQSTEMMMIGAETVGVKLEDAHPSYGNSNFTADSVGSYGSLQTMTGGSAVLEAGLDLKRQILEQATKPLPPKNAPLLDAKPEECDTGDGFVFVKADPSKRVPIVQVVASTGGPMMGRGAHPYPRGYGMSTFAAGFAEVEVDLDTGELTLLAYTAANDVGRAVNRLGVEQQQEGGSSMGMGMGLGEEIKFDPQFHFALNWNWENYAMPTVLETPKFADYKTVIVESGDAVGPYGAKGVGEPPVSPPSPAIANAIYNAIGVRIHDAPLTRDKVLRAISQMKRG